MKITVTIDIDDHGPNDRAIRHATAILTRNDQGLADAVAAAGSVTPTPSGPPHMPPKNVPHQRATPTGNPTIDALITQVGTDQTVIGSAVVLINGIAAAITAAVNAAIAGGATAAQLAPLTDLTTSLAASDDALAAAVTANTPNPPPVGP